MAHKPQKKPLSRERNSQILNLLLPPSQKECSASRVGSGMIPAKGRSDG